MPDDRSFAFEEWGPDEEISARKLNQPLAALRSLTQGIRPPQQIPPNPSTRASVEIQQFQIVSISGDYLICYPFNGIEADTSRSIVVARPPLLRTSQTSRGDLEFSYTDEQSRTADNGSSTEDQVIVPSYQADDIIFAIRNITGGTGVTYGPTDKAVEWQDLNLDARAWAKESST